jgi:hypothetical protein
MKVGSRIVFIILFVAYNCFGQDNIKRLGGEVTFTTSVNAYVKFSDTEKIKIGDTLQLSANSVLSNCLVVKNKSSISCVCAILTGCEVKAGDVILHPVLLETTKTNPTKEIRDRMVRKPVTAMTPEQIDSINSMQKISGRISVASYSTLSSLRGDNHRTMYRLGINVSHFQDSRFSLESDMNYRQNFVPAESKSSQRTKQYNVYNLALRYETPSKFSLVVGRKINMNASSIGAIDGVQAEKYFGKFYTGIIAGFRPDIFNQNFNSNLLEFGGYIGLKTNAGAFKSQTTLGLLEQKNAGATDRRYVYFQHSSTVGRNLNLFSSVELDIYDKVNEQISTDARLTNLYASASYRISKVFNVFVSYDSRKRILYYETFKTEIENLLDDDEARQGARVRLNIKPLKNTTVGLSYSKRFQSSGQNASDNMNGYITFSKIPIVRGLLNVSYNINISNYLESKIWSFRHSRYLFKNKLNVDLYYRIIEYAYKISKVNDALNNTYKQSYIGSNLTYQFAKKISFSIMGEANTLATEKNYRINARIIKRF